MRYSNDSPVNISSPKSPKSTGFQAPTSSPSASFHKHHQRRNKIVSSSPPSYYISPTTSIQQGLVFIPYDLPQLNI